MSVTLAELERRLWDAANALRGPVDPADFKTYTFPMLFWKWISDTHDWERAQAINEYGEGVPTEVEADYHRFTVPTGANWRHVTVRTDNLGTHIGTALGRLEQANPNSLAGIFGDAVWGNKERLPESALLALVNAFNGLTLNPDVVSHDLLGQAYEYLLKNFADESGKKAGEFFTPRQVVKLIVRCLDPQPGESIYDPAAGSGGMLVETINNVRDHRGDTRTLRLYGQEVNLTTAAIARMNLFLHEIEDFRIVRGDTLRSPGLREPDGSLARFDVVIANPPFILKNWGAEIWAGDARNKLGLPPTQNADFAWVQHMLASADQVFGRVGVVMPHGILFRGHVERGIRERLVRSGWLKSVIGLPPNLFYSTTMRACILVLAAPRSGPESVDVMLVDASRAFTKARGDSNTMTDDHVTSVLQSYSSGIGHGVVRVAHATLADIAAQEWNLSLGRYIPGAGRDDLAMQEAISEVDQAWLALMSALDGLVRDQLRNE